MTKLRRRLRWQLAFSHLIAIAVTLVSMVGAIVLIAGGWVSRGYDARLEPAQDARTVADAELLYNVLAGRSVDACVLRVEDLRGLRASVFIDESKAPVTGETREVVARAGEALKDVGLVLVDERPPGFDMATDLWLSLFSRETQRIVCAAHKGREEEETASHRIDCPPSQS